MSGERIWTRLTPDITDENDLPGLRAEVHDPLWTLGRQWQVGDLSGEDGGSPVRVDAWVERDRARRYDFGGGPTEYDPDNVPLETVVEREAIVTGGDRPDMGTAVEAGLQFLRLLDRHGHHVGGAPPSAADLAREYQVDKGDYEAGVAVPESEEARRFEMVVAKRDRAVDGYNVYDALVTAMPNLPAAEAADDGSVDWAGASALPVPGSAVDPAYKRAAKAFIDWYADLFNEPTGDDDAWNPSRLEYDFDIATGEGDTETVFSADEYPGGRLDWAAFEADPDASMSGGSEDGDGGNVTADPSGVTEADIADHQSVIYDAEPSSVATAPGETAVARPDIARMPGTVTYPGMPSSRWWEVEDGSVNLFGADIGPGELGKEVMIDFAVTYGEDWFSVPLEAELGTTQRVTALAVVDSFGAMEVARPSLEVANDEVGASDRRWKLFTEDLGPNHAEPGLFVPPTLAESFESDPLERVLFVRDELANLAWAIEERVLDPYGIRVDLEEFDRGSLRIAGLRSAGDPAEEAIEFENPGDEPIDIGDWTLVVERATDSGTVTETFQFGSQPGDITVPDAGTLEVIPAVGNDTAETLFWDWDGADGAASLITDAQKVTLRNARGWPVGYRDLRSETGTGSLPAYRLASDVFDHWYPLKPRQQATGGFAVADTEFALARLVDADVDILPTPKGRILREYVPESADADAPTVHDEELTRAGAEVVRSYQLARWTDGGAHMWSARQAGPGFGQGSSGLRYDYLESPDDK